MFNKQGKKNFLFPINEQDEEEKESTIESNRFSISSDGISKKKRASALGNSALLSVMTKNKIGNSFAESGPKRSVGIGKGISKIKVGINEKAHRDI